MYTRACTRRMNEKVLMSFLIPNGLLRILIATIAFSMGKDCQDIRCIIHFGPPATITKYVRETGRGGCDGHPAVALLYYRNPGKHVEKHMKLYDENCTVCRRHLLFKQFLFYTQQNTITGCTCCEYVQKTVRVTNVASI